MLKSFFITLPMLFIFDFIWLGIVMKSYNIKQFETIGRIEDGKFQILFLPAVLAYLFMALALTIFSVPRAIESDSHAGAFVWGALLGLVIYGTYDMTNLSLLKDYPVQFTIVDIAWGTFLFGLVTLLTRMILKIWT